MFSDPNGEVFQFAFLAAMGAFWATVMTGAIISSAIATFLYLAKAYLTRNFSVGGFFKAVTIGSITGAYQQASDRYSVQELFSLQLETEHYPEQEVQWYSHWQTELNSLKELQKEQ